MRCHPMRTDWAQMGETLYIESTEELGKQTYGAQKFMAFAARNLWMKHKQSAAACVCQI